MAYATILVRFFNFFITGTADKESWEGCHGRGFCIIYGPVLSTCVVYFIMRRASMRDWVLDHYTSGLPNCFSAPFELCDRRWRTS